MIKKTSPDMKTILGLLVVLAAFQLISTQDDGGQYENEQNVDGNPTQDPSNAYPDADPNDPDQMNYPPNPVNIPDQINYPPNPINNPDQINYPPPDPNYPPNHPGQINYPPNQMNNPGQMNYPAPDPNYPPNQMSNPGQMNYPPPDQNYPPNQMNYPPPDPNYPPNQMNYPPPDPNYPPNQMNNPNQMNYPPNQMNNQNQMNFPPAAPPPPPPQTDDVRCHCGEIARKTVVKKDTPNKGREMYVCPRPQHDPERCRFFLWGDQVEGGGGGGGGGSNYGRSNQGGYGRQAGSGYQQMSNFKPKNQNYNQYPPGGANQPKPNYMNGPQQSPNEDIQCGCGAPAKKFVVKKDTPNKGREFYACPRMRNDPERCGFFLWA